MPHESSPVMLKPMWWWLPPSKSLSSSHSFITSSLFIYLFLPFPCLLPFYVCQAASMRLILSLASSLLSSFCLYLPSSSVLTPSRCSQRGSTPSHPAPCFNSLPLTPPSPPHSQSCIWRLPCPLPFFDFFCCLLFFCLFYLPHLFCSVHIFISHHVPSPVFFHITPLVSPLLTPNLFLHCHLVFTENHEWCLPLCWCWYSEYLLSILWYHQYTLYWACLWQQGWYLAKEIAYKYA